MDSLYLAIVFSFLAGALGYIIIRFWVIPIARYRRARRQLILSLEAYMEKLPADNVKHQKKLPGKKHLRDIQRLHTQLLEIHEVDLPYWYRLLLSTRNESPQAASEPIQRMEKMTAGSQARQCLDDVCRHLGAQL